MRETSKIGGATEVCAGCPWHGLCATPATAATCAHGGRQLECGELPDRASGCPHACRVGRGVVHTGATDALVDRPPAPSVHRQVVSVGGGDSVEVHSTLEELSPAQRATGGAPAWFVWLGYFWHVVVYGAAAFGFLTAYFLLTVPL